MVYIIYLESTFNTKFELIHSLFYLNIKKKVISITWLIIKDYSMKKSIKIVLSFCFALLTVLSNNCGVFAQDNNYSTLYPHTTMYISNLCTSNTYDVRVFDNKSNDITQNFLKEFKNQHINAIMENYINNDYWIMVENDPLKQEAESVLNNVQARYTKTITKTTSPIYRILKINGRKTSNELGGYIRATCTYDDNTGRYISVRDPYLYNTIVTSGTCSLKFKTTISSTRSRVVHDNFKINVVTVVSGNNSALNVTYDTETIDESLIFN